MKSSSLTWSHLLFAAPWFSQAMAGYLSVSMTPATQCNSSVVTWSGDEGPYHLLLTPTDFNQHGYNVWIPEIPANATNYTLPINQPAGASFLLTMWGKSGISYAGTSDVMTVGPSSNTSCFLTDPEILSLYAFSFNITDTYGGYPPQCENITITWPTSLESNVTSGIPKRDQDRKARRLNCEVERMMEDELEHYDARDESSSSNSGNTTYPPTIFGVIPLGNSFSIPITYGNDTPIAQNLPASSLSSNPTSWTSQGVTSLNWTVEMAKGTRFILVAGIGSEKQWANGGSSRMMTVGQGDSFCMGVTPNDPAPPPSITGVSTATSTPSPSPNVALSGNRSSPSTTKIAIASVVSVIATLLIVGLFLLCRRRLRRRRDVEQYLPQSYSPAKSPSRLGALSPLDTQLDLIGGPGGARASDRNLSRVQSAHGTGAGNTPTSPTGSNPFLDSPNRASDRERGYQLAERTLSTDDTWSTPVSPARDGYPEGILTPLYPQEHMNRSMSRDELLLLNNIRSGRISPPRGGRVSPPRGGRMSPQSPIDEVSSMPPLGRSRTPRPLQLHTRPQRTSGLAHSADGHEDRPEGEDDEEEDITTLKRDTLAYLGSAQQGGSRRRSPRRRPEEMEYVVHRDAGRVRPPQHQQDDRRILELPPRYEELQWEDGPEARETRTA